MMSPKAIPHPTDCTRRANHPAAAPAIIPLMQEPIMMPISALRTAGVNHAVAPSRMPRIPPTRSPITILFISFLRWFSSTSRRNPLTAEPQKDNQAHDDVCGHDAEERRISRDPAPGAFDDRWAIRLKRLTIQIAADLRRQRGP